MGVKHVYLFGSVARDAAVAASDIDMLQATSIEWLISTKAKADESRCLARSTLEESSAK